MASSDVFSALASPVRRSLLELLSDKPHTVNELADRFDMRRPSVSEHLKILKDAGLVEDVAAGTRRIYRLNPVALAALRDQLDTYWQRALVGYADAAEAPTKEG